MKLLKILIGISGLVSAEECSAEQPRPEMQKVDWSKVYIDNPIDVMPTSREGGWTGIGSEIKGYSNPRFGLGILSGDLWFLGSKIFDWLFLSPF